MKVGFRVDIGNYASALRVRFTLSSGEHTWDALKSSVRTVGIEIREAISLPKVIELVIPRPFLKSTSVDGANAVVHTVDADFIGPESDDVTVLDVGGVNGAVLLVGESLYEDPEG